MSDQPDEDRRSFLDEPINKNAQRDQFTLRQKTKWSNQGMDLTVAVAQQIWRFIAAGKV